MAHYTLPMRSLKLTTSAWAMHSAILWHRVHSLLAACTTSEPSPATAHADAQQLCMSLLASVELSNYNNCKCVCRHCLNLSIHYNAGEVDKDQIMCQPPEPLMHSALYGLFTLQYSKPTFASHEQALFELFCALGEWNMRRLT